MTPHDAATLHVELFSATTSVARTEAVAISEEREKERGIMS
ncbi:MAG: hypothetical protein WD557_05805 [Dehalococcoidia bacterium]